MGILGDDLKEKENILLVQPMVRQIWQRAAWSSEAVIVPNRITLEALQL